MEKDSLLTGFVIGAIVPVIGYFLFENLFEFLSAKGVLAEAIGESLMRRVRTIELIAICSNIIPFEIGRRKHLDDTLRGIVFPTLIYVGFWIYKYYYILFH
jgi:hypothetical protein